MEEWKKIEDFNDYFISSKGRIRSLKKKKDKILKNTIGKNGYRVVIFYESEGWGKGYKQKREYIHRLLARYFIPNPDNKPEVNHKDGNKLNNSLENLEWVTHQENMMHASYELYDRRGEKSPHAVLTQAEANAIRQRYLNGGIYQRELAREHGVALSTINLIVNNKGYKI